MTALSPAAQLERLRRGTVEIVTEEALLAKLAEGRPLRVKLGLDPTAPDLHIGNAIVLQKLRQFQDLGHEAVLIIGDFTGLIGDPSGKSETRPSLTPQEIERNAETYREQYSRILDPHRTRVAFNSQWLGAMKFYDVIKLAGRTTVHRILERDDFAKRYAERLPIHLHELLYPLCQAYDSVAVQADVELGGTDQKFNNLMGRELQREVGQAPQVVVLTPLLPGLDGVQKMSKSLGNAIGITDPPNEMYGKVMSLPDPLMIPYFEYCTQVPLEEIRALEAALGSGRAHPRDAKRRLAREITRRYHGEAAALAAEAEFDRVFGSRELPEEIPDVTLGRDRLRGGRIRLARLLVETGLADSNTDARRLISQGGVSLDRARVHEDLEVEVRDGLLVQVGRRRFARVRLGE
ncbi:MAG: tyrosine--tRNA ligase [Bacillati bacterium ANGP1]|uniref:Tyrosine--tRNA ligase n=1 Tax=Candidatus Segetimicrobium genomatis TaxID=2569760 RepID=A0A537K4I5_9BACT|nr:MAG: tyrosine--tRNA ligase [Terrabacteria group bacterium ANGP1]